MYVAAPEDFRRRTDDLGGKPKIQAAELRISVPLATTAPGFLVEEL